MVLDKYFQYFKGGAPEQDVIEKSIGAFGRYHYWLCFLVFLSKPPMLMHQMAIIFLSPKVTFTCDGEQNKCPCENPEYDRSLFTESIIMHYNLICGKSWFGSFVQTSFQFGTLLGSVFFGMAADRFGRKMPFTIAGVVELITGIAASYMSTYWGFIVCRLFCGAAVGGTMVIGFVVLSEFIGAKHRTVVASLYQVPATLGHLVVPGFGYFFRSYRDFQFAISTTAAVMLLYIFFLPETPRWLLAMKKNEEAIALLEKVAKINNHPITNIRSDVLAHAVILQKHHVKKGTLLDLFRTPNLRIRILAMAYCWLSCSFCFYGVSQYVSHLSGNIFINVAASAFCTTIGAFGSIGLLQIMGRRTLVILGQTVCVVCFVILAVQHDGIIAVICSCIGIVSAFTVFIVVYLYTSEMFPTVVRNAAMGFSSMIARVGSMIAPAVLDLGRISLSLPPIVFALVPGLGILATLLLPETKNCKMLCTLEEGENFRTQKKNTVPNN